MEGLLKRANASILSQRLNVTNISDNLHLYLQAHWRARITEEGGPS